MVTAKDINHGHILYDQARHTSEEAFEKRITDKSRPNIGDVLVTKDGTLGRLAVVDRLQICINQSVALLKPNSKIRSRFLRYLLEFPDNFNRMIGDADGTTIKHIYITRLAKMPVRVPCLSIQDQIVGLLGALDDKIELNRRMAGTLEEMARALYRSWFVDFDPVRARAAGLAPTHMDPATAALFPDRFGPDGLPEGWKEYGLDEIATFLNGAALQKYPVQEDDEGLPVIKISELRNGVTEKSGRASMHLPKKFKIADGDVLFSWSGSLVQRVWDGGPGALNQHLFKVSSNLVPRWLHYFAVDHHIDDFRQTTASKATTMGHIQRHHLAQAKVWLPSQDVLLVADRQIGPLFERMVHCSMESRTLVALRDALLPKLMSGELTVREAEAQASEVA